MLLLTALGSAAPVGRYGWVQTPPVPGWTLKTDGLKPEFARSDTLRFGGEIRKWRMLQTDGKQAQYALISTGGAPTKARSSIFGWGIELLFERGLALHVSSLQPPLLTWSEGSADKEVPTAAAKWVAISYQDSQPPVILCFCGQSVGLVVTGKPGSWTIKADGPPYKGWVRFGLPLGLRALTTTDAVTLGVLAHEITAHDAFWSLPKLPKLTTIEVAATDTTLETKWMFDQAGAVVPEAAILAARGGYKLELSELGSTEAPLLTGPLVYSVTPTLEIRFPAIQIPAGRAVTSGTVQQPELPKAKHAASFVQAMRSQFANASSEDLRALAAARAAFLEQATVTLEPNTVQRFPVGKGGVVAPGLAAATLSECARDRSGPTPALLKTLSWTFDWGKWAWLGETQQDRRRAAALVSIAGSLRLPGGDRLLGAMAHAGLCAERGRNVYSGAKEGNLLLEPIETFRNALYPTTGLPITNSVLLDALRSPVRMVVGPQLRAVNRGNAYEISWQARNTGIAELQFFPPLPGEPVLTKNLATAEFDLVRGVWRAKASAPGQVTLTIKSSPELFLRLAKSAQPIYSESLR